jgi:hypothetical protein
MEAVSASLGIPPAWLRALIQFESRWQPAARNPISGARGLIQFTNTTARGMGYADADDLVTRHPTIEAQLSGPVLAYLTRYKPFPTQQSFYMSVFYPAARNWPASQAFSRAIRTVNPGIVTVGDYVNRVNGTKVKMAIGGVLLLAVAAGALWYQYTTKQGGRTWPARVKAESQSSQAPEGITLEQPL